MAEDAFKANIGMALLTLGSTVEELLKEIAKYHDGRSGAWLDELHEKFVRNVKNSSSMGISLDSELTAMQAAIAMLNHHFSSARSEMLPPI